MALKFKRILKSFLPVGKFWDEQEEIDKILDAESQEFKRHYDLSTKFYNEYNIVESYELADIHAKDYLLVEGLYSKQELQRIIVKYLNQDLGFKEIIEDFANFINVPIFFGNPHQPFIFGQSKFGDQFGDKDNPGIMELLIKFNSAVTCLEYNKVVWLSKYLAPPYLEVTFSAIPINSDVAFAFGSSKFGDKFRDIEVCELIN